MPTLELSEEARTPGQKVCRIAVDSGTVNLQGPSVDIRFPTSWARKLLPWLGGQARNIVCNADVRRFNLVGITKSGDKLILSYVGSAGQIQAEGVSRQTLYQLDELLHA